MNSSLKEAHLAVAQAIKLAQETFLLRTEIFDVMATELKAKYDSLLLVGFTPDQAFELLKSKAL